MKTNKQTNEDTNKEPDESNLPPYLRKDVGFCHAVAIGVTSAAAALLGVVSAALLSQLSYYRKDPPIGAHWTSGLFYISPGITGLVAAYKRRVLSLTSHMGVSFLSLFLGCLTTYYSVETFYVDECESYSHRGECLKESLMALCMTGILGGAILGASSFVLSAYAYRSIRILQSNGSQGETRTDQEGEDADKGFNYSANGRENIAMDTKTPDQMVNENDRNNSKV
ncbi:hypothetical protein Ahia01_000554500 [Argonauta hians]